MLLTPKQNNKTIKIEQEITRTDKDITKTNDGSCYIGFLPDKAKFNLSDTERA